MTRPYISKNDLLRALSFGKIIDIGCFEGELFASNAINVDYKVYKSDVPNFIRADAHKLPFKSNSFDTAVLGEVLEHVDDPLIVLNEAHRVAVAVIFSVPNEYEWDRVLNPFDNPGHKRFFTEQMIKDLFADAGLILDNFFKVNLLGWSHFVGRGVHTLEPSWNNNIIAPIIINF